jgi:micrococcal nuclease
VEARLRVLLVAIAVMAAACTPDGTSDRVAAPRSPRASSTPTPAEPAPTSRPAPADTPSPSKSPRPSTDPAPTAPPTNAVVTRVVDGDTIEARHKGTVIDVRLIGIDTPETVHPSQPVECFGKAASTFTSTQLTGRAVRLEFDVERIDRYGRTLAYVWTGGRLFNETLVRQGFASVSTYPPNVRYVDRFLAAERSAREQDRGLWGACTAGATSSPAPSGGGCDPSYPDVCIPPYPPDLDCGDISFRRFQVSGDDPHGFDGDRDGVGCES